MITLRIVADGDSDASRANNRGHLFEKVCTQVLRAYGYDIDKNTPTILHSGMEIDIEGHHSIALTPLYAECKCFASDISSPQVQAFMGKYMVMWLKNKKAQGLFIAIPKVNSSALGFFRDYLESSEEVTLRLLQETDVIDALVKSRAVISHDAISAKTDEDKGVLGDALLIGTDRGFFWAQYLIPHGATVPTIVQLFDSTGGHVTDNASFEFLTRLLPEMASFTLLQTTETPRAYSEPYDDPIVEMRGSSSCFEYQFPASPQFFVGRTQLLSTFDNYLLDVATKQSTARSLLFQGNSGWGKSSLVLACCESATKAGHFSVSIDARSALHPGFLLSAANHVLQKFGDFDRAVTSPMSVGGVDSAVDCLLDIGRTLERKGKVLVVFFDQFENVFYVKTVLEKMAQAVLRVTDAQTNTIFGFAWKSDLVGLTGPFPYRLRDSIADAAQTMLLGQFSEIETEALLDRLATELRAKLRKDLRFLIAEFSQGYPWLLKKLCAHVRSLRDQGMVQADIARGLLNVEDLFKEDLQGLTADQLNTLHLIAKCAPVNVHELPDDVQADTLQSLIDRRLIVKVGIRYDIYWDIFRDYLNTGRLPVDEIYLLRAPIGGVLRALHTLNSRGGRITISEFCVAMPVSEKGFFNLAKDLRLLSLARVEDNHVVQLLPVAPDDDSLRTVIVQHLKEKLPRNRSLNGVLIRKSQEGDISLECLAELLMSQFPYISASSKTWNTYAKIAASWLDYTDLAILDKSVNALLPYDASRQIRDRSLSFVKRRKRVSAPAIQFNPMVRVARRLCEAAQAAQSVDWQGIRKTTVYKSLAMLEALEFINRRQSTIVLTPDCEAFALQPERRISLAAPRALKMAMFYQFIQLLISYAGNARTHKQIADDFRKKTQVDWAIGTA